MIHFSKIIHYIVKEAIYPLTTYVLQNRKVISLFILLYKWSFFVY